MAYSRSLPGCCYSTLDLRYHKHFFDTGLDPAKCFSGSRHRQVADVDVFDASLQQRMDAAGADLFRMNLCGKITLQFFNGNRNEVRKHSERLRIWSPIVKDAEYAWNFHSQTLDFIDELIDGRRLIMRNDLSQVEV